MSLQVRESLSGSLRHVPWPRVPAMPSAALLAALDMPGLVRESEKSQRALSFWRDGFSYLAGGPWGVKGCKKVLDLVMSLLAAGCMAVLCCTCSCIH